ncbi:MAG: hypothetical protein ACOCXS_00920 [Bacteroidota bacterium]
MAIPRLFKIPRHRQFNYRPIYYNAEKEELQERIKKIEQEYGKKQESKVGKEYRPSIRRGIMRGNYRQVTKAKRQSNIRLIVILLVLFALAYYIFYSQLAG